MASHRFKGRLELARAFRRLRLETRREVEQSLRDGALLITNEAVELIQQQLPSGVFYPSRGRKGALHEASPAGGAPNADTGELHTGITSVEQNTFEGFEVTTGPNSPYGPALELGTSKMEPRPFMSPAFRLNLDRIDRRARNSVRRAVQNIRRANARG